VADVLRSSPKPRAGVARDQFAKDGIRSNVILPSATERAMQIRWQAEPDLKAPLSQSLPQSTGPVLSAAL
jgi:hypothetical protein